MLITIGGSGAAEVTKLATFMSEYRIFEIEILKTYGLTEWRDDLTRLMKQTGAKDAEPTTFLFSDTQIQDEIFVEHLNMLLNTGKKYVHENQCLT